MSEVLGHARDELRRWVEHPARILLLLAPFVATALCLWIYSGRVARHMPVVVVDQDRSALSRALRRDLAATPQMDVSEVQDLSDAHLAVKRGRARAVLLLPRGMDDAVRQGRTASLVFWRDASNPSASNQLFSAISTIVATENGRLTAGRLVASGLSVSQAKNMVLPLRGDPRALYNPNFDYLACFAPGLLPVFLLMGLLLAGASLLPHDWSVRRAPYREFLGRSLPWVAFDLLASAVYHLWLVPHLGASHAPALPTLALSFLLITGALATGVLAGRLSFTVVLATQTMLAFATPAFLLSGYTFPEWAFPRWLETATRPFPFTLFMDSYRGFAGWASGLSWKGMLGLSLWTLVPALLLALPVRKAKDQRPAEPPSPPARSLLEAFGAEFRRIRTTLGLALMFFVAPVEYFALYGAVFLVKTETKMPVAVTNAQASPLSREITRALQAHPLLDAMPVASEDEARRALQDGTVRAIVELPVDMDQRLRRRDATLVPLVFTTDRFLSAADIQKAVSAVLLERGERERAQIVASRGIPPSTARIRATALALDDRPLANPNETYGDFMLPLLGILILHQVAFTSTAFATAMGSAGLRNLLARVLIYAGWLGAWTAVWFCGVLRLLHVPIQPHAGPLVVLTLLGLVAVGFAGSVAGRLFKHPLSTLQLIPFSSYPVLFISGSSWPREVFPPLARALSHLVPATPWLLGGNRALRLDAGFSDLGPEFLNLGLLALGWGVFAVVLARVRRPAST